MSLLPRANPLVLAVGVVAALGVWLVQDRVIELEPGAPAWSRLVGGAAPSGRVPAGGRAVVTLPGFRRGETGQARIELEGSNVALRVRVDAGAPFDLRTDREGVAVVSIPKAATAGARLFVAPVDEAPLRLRRVTLEATSPPYWPVALALVFTVGVGFFSSGAALPLAAASFAMLGAVSALVWFSLPSPWAILHVAPILLTFGASIALGRGQKPYWRGVAFLAALVLGTWVRFYFLASAGSWDTEYWKAWMTRAVTHGTTHVYGDADATPDGQFFRYLSGRAELFQPEYKGRSFVVDYPPLAMALWRWSWIAVDALLTDFDHAEKENIAVKLPAALGDVAAFALLLFLFPGRPAAAAAYWALPLSWLPSAILGFFDAAYVPLAVLGLVAATRKRALASGVLLALAALIKPQALIMAPVAAVALGPDRRLLGVAVGSGLGTVAVALVPFLLAGTLDEAVTHVFRIIFQERLSAGFANPWWVLGHVVNGGAWSQPVQYARIDAVGFPVGIVGVMSFFALFVLFCRRFAREACFAAGAVVFAYGLFAMGVHENHPHAMFLAFVASGLSWRANRRRFLIVACLGASYVLNMLSLSVLGRFYGLRYLAVESIASALGGLRMALGLDVTLLLAVVNTALMIALLVEAFGRRDASPR